MPEFELMSFVFGISVGALITLGAIMILSLFVGEDE